MKKILMAAATTALLAGNTFAANLVVTSYFGESLATYSKTDDDNDDNDGISFFDHYMDADPGKSPFNNVSLSGETANGGGEIALRWEQKKINMTTLNGWLNFQGPFGIPGTLTLKFGRFDARPAVDFVGDANRGFHYQGYAVNPLTGNAGFDPHVMNWFLTQQGFAHSTHNRVKASQGTYWTAQTAGSLTSLPWFFNNLNNACGSIVYSGGWRYDMPTFMVQYAPNDDLIIRWGATSGGSADGVAGAISHDFYGQKTFTNWNAQVSYNVGDIAKLGLTVKMSDALSGVYTTGDGMWHSAGTDLTASLAASSDALVDGLKLFVGYGFAGVYMGMKGDLSADESKSGKAQSDLSETYLFHAIDLRAVYELDEQLSFGLNGNVSMVNQSEYAKEAGFDDDYLGFSVGLSASYALSDILAIDFNAGFHCLDVNNEVGTDRDTGATGKGDMLAVSSIGVEPSLVITLNQNAALSIGVNMLIQNLSGDDVFLTAPNTNHLSVSGTQYPFTTTVTLPLFLFIRI